MDPVIRLSGARVALTGRSTEKLDLVISRGRITALGGEAAGKATVSATHDLSGYLILPGLINAHDHLEFNLFPRLGRGPYANASQWAADIYRPNSTPVREHLLVPKSVRLIWGGIKNLLSGVTTVAHHNPWEPVVFSETFPVRVLRRYGWAHSLEFSPDLVSCCLKTPPCWPFIVHAAEGTDQRACAELWRLDALGILGHRTVLVHAAGAGLPELDMIYKRAASIVWCPSSNLFTLGRTLCAEAIGSSVLIALGTDSAMTAEGDLIDEIRVAREAGSLSTDEIYELVTVSPAKALRLREGQGTIQQGGIADLMVVKDEGQTPAEALVTLHPELVLLGGKIMLASTHFAHLTGRGFHPIGIEGRGQWLIRANVPRLLASAVAEIGRDIRLAGRRVCL